MCIRRDHCDRCPGTLCPHLGKSCLPSHSWLPTAPTGERASLGCIVRNPKLLQQFRHRISGRCCTCHPLQRCGQHWCRRRDCACRPESPGRHLRGTHRDSMAHSSSMDEEGERCRCDHRYEVGNLAVAVAGDVLQGCVAGRTLVQTLDRHDREELVNGPTVWQALEQ